MRINGYAMRGFLHEMRNCVAARVYIKAGRIVRINVCWAFLTATNGFLQTIDERYDGALPDFALSCQLKESYSTTGAGAIEPHSTNE